MPKRRNGLNPIFHKQQTHTPRGTAGLGLRAMARYKASGIADPVREKLHETIALRLSKVIAANSWEV